MGTIEKELINTLENETKTLENDPLVLEFDKANKEFSQLVEKGFARRRGNNQMSVDQINSKKYTFNTSVQKF